MLSLKETSVGVGSRVYAQAHLPWERWPAYKGSLQIPHELRFRVHVAHTVLCKPLVQTVECGSQEAPNDPHRDEETQIHSCPEMTFFIRVRALREGGKGGREKNQSGHENRKGKEQRQEQERVPSFPAEGSGCPGTLLTGAGVCRSEATCPTGLSLKSKFHGYSEISREEG